MPQRHVIFTAGFHARATCRWLLRQPGCEVVAFVDNNPAIQGGTLLGRPVLAPAALTALDYDCVALPGRNQEPILRQLRDELGVPAERIWLVRKSEVPPSAAELSRRGAALAALLQRVLAVLRGAGSPHWAMHSSLLGLVRGDDLALFSDCDLCVGDEGFDALAARFPAFDLRAVPAGAGQATRYGQLTLHAPVSSATDEPALIDLHPVAFNDGEAIWSVNGGTLRLPAGPFRHEARMLAYRGVLVPVPAQPEALLTALYGEGWQVPAETWNGRYAPRTTALAGATSCNP